VPTAQTLIAFTLVSVGIVIMPGPSNLFLLAHGIGHGRRAAVAAMTGISAASAIRVLLTAAGLTALLASSAVAFDTVRWAGVAYLVYLGGRALRSAPAHGPAPDRSVEIRLRRSAGKGLIVGLGNPKMLIFFVAFFPQFVDPARGSEVLQILLLGSIFWVLGALWDLIFACLSGTIGNWLERRPRVRKAQPRAEGVAYLGLAAWALAAGAHPE
jgi:threonine/homoserine/homoserine lactone efflux protein